ncbi:hypothetical protein SUGI_0204630 [Cryptomeria japonica]|uniref:vacuolar protein 8 n=1 Tax=Cryptomeria japonica TaxID=3369 RepID=UPI0024089DE5|nr:vacuolar protein 8 [Cryptomeria japonica]GLJ13072.1 hypothetical protein SUGI_0204630 [Cryptomeria japonica]
MEQHPEGDFNVSSLHPEQCFAVIEQLIAILLISCSKLKVFIGRWQIIRTRLDALKVCITDVSESPHWSENELLTDLLPGVHATLLQTRELTQRCSDGSFGGKLLMQSDLDVVAAKLNLHVHDLELLIKTGVLNKSNAIVLARPGPGAGREEVCLFARDLFARVQIGHTDFKRKALESLIQLLSEDPKNAVLVAREGDMACLVHILDSPNVLKELAVEAVAILAQTDGCRHGLVIEGALGPLVRMLETSGAACKEKAALAIEGLTRDGENAWALAAYGGVSVLIEVCQSGVAAVRAPAVGALRNVAGVKEIRQAMAEEGAIPVLLSLAVSDSIPVQENAIECLHALASNDEKMRQMIAGEGGIQSLLGLLSEQATPKSQELIIRAINSLSASLTAAKALISASGFLKQLASVLKNGHSTVQQLAASAICNLSFNKETKKALGEAGCIPPLVKMLEAKPSTSQEMAAQALSSLLVVETNRREFVKDDKSVARLVQLLDPRNQTVAKKFPLSALLALSTSKSCRKKIAMAGACQHLQKLAEMEVTGAKKILQRIAGSRLRNIFSRRWRD